MIRSITPFLWFDDGAEQAARFYCSVFPDASVDSTSPMVTEFTLQGQSFMALNGGKQDFRFNESVSFFVTVETQEEVDRLWDALTADGGEPGRCGWLKDRYGISWQIVPTELMTLLRDENDAVSDAAFNAMLEMQKIEIGRLHEALPR